MQQTQDIDTTSVPAPITIDGLPALTDTIARAAQLALVIATAEKRQQAAVETAKAAFESATRETSEELKSLFAGIEAACAANKDAWFPAAKNGKRKKTLAVLQHEIKYRDATSIQTEGDPIGNIREALAGVEAQLGTDLDTEERATLDATHSLLLNLLRQPPEELNRQAALAAAAKEQHTDLLADLGITRHTTETFRVVFHFTPNA